MEKYRNRLADEMLSWKLRVMGAVLVQGPKWCGKTSTAEHIAKSTIFMDYQDNVDLAEINIQYILQGETPRLIDEWQLAPQIWDAVRFEIDHRDNGRGQFILTGSAVPADRSKIHHSGAGRFSWLRMHTMSLFEAGESTGEVSLSDLFNGATDIFGHTDHTLSDIAFFICRGGWPQAIDLPRADALRLPQEYLETVVEKEISRVDGISRNPALVRRLLQSYSRYIGQSVSISAITADVNGGSRDVTDKTISSYLKALRQIFVVEDLPTWYPNLRSRSAIRTSDTRFFADPSIGAAALRISPEDLVKDLRTTGFFFKALCVRDLRVYAEVIDGDLYHFRDRNGLECDAVLELRNGRYGLIEIKLGGEKLIEEGVKSLNSLASKIDVEKMGEPAFKMVLTAVGTYAFRRKDGVLEVPVGCLKP